MNSLVARRRAAAVTAGFAVAVSSLVVGVADAGVAADRTASTAVDSTYLQDALGVAADTRIESVTYNRLNWLLQQEGQFAFVVGSPNDTGFKTRVQEIDTAAKAANVKKVYWFDPNLSGFTGLKNLDTRNPTGITTISTAAQNVYGNTWKNLLAQYLGNGYKASGVGTGTISIAADDTVVNDAVDPLWDYRTSPEEAPVGASDDVFFVYDKLHKGPGDVADKIRGGVNLSGTFAEPATPASAVADVITAVGGANLDEIGQFEWWQSENNRILSEQGDPKVFGKEVLGDADGAKWNVLQLTYPALLHLLDIKDSADKNFVLLFGGTWCPNTRAVIKDVNKQAVANGVTVYNFDTILDGSLLGGGNTGSNPLQTRNNANYQSTASYVPSFIYGDLVRTYLRNIVTEYDPNTGNRVLYYPNGDTTAVPDVVRKLQVPFLANYQRGTGANPSTSSVKRQWIQEYVNTNSGQTSFKEYMSQFWYTNPTDTRLGLKETDFPLEITTIPADPASAPDTAFLTAAEQAGTDEAAKTTLVNSRRSKVISARAGEAFGQEAVAKLKSFFGGLPGAVASTQTVVAPRVTYGTAPKVTLGISDTYGRIPAGTATLSVGGKDYPVTVAQNSAVFTVAKLAPGTHPFTVKYTADTEILGFQKAGTLTVAKAKVSKAAGSAVKVPTSKRAGSYKVTVSTASGLAKASGKVTVTLTKGKAKKTVAGSLKSGVVTVKVPKLAKGTWKVSLGYAGDAHYVAAKASGTAVKVKK